MAASRARRREAFGSDELGDRGVFLKELVEAVVDNRGDDPLDLAVAELGFGLALELRVGEADGDDGRQAFAEVVPLRDVILEDVRPLAVVVDRAGERTLEAAQMCAAFEIADVVGEGADVLGVAVVVLQGDADLGVFEAAVDADHVGEQRIFGAVQVFDELDDAVLVLELVRLAAALVGNEDPRAGGEKGELLQPLVEDVVAEFRVGENLRIGPEGDLGAGAFALAKLLEPAHHGAAGEVHGPDVAFAADLGLEPFGKCVDRRDADAVQSAGPRFVAAGAVEFSAGVDFGEHDFEGRAVVHVGHGSDGDAAAVVGDGDAAVGVEADDDHAGKAVDRLVDAVIDDFVDEVVQAAGVVSPIYIAGRLRMPSIPSRTRISLAS